MRAHGLPAATASSAGAFSFERPVTQQSGLFGTTAAGRILTFILALYTTFSPGKDTPCKISRYTA